jgi:hypothetical protein
MMVAPMGEANFLFPLLTRTGSAPDLWAGVWEPIAGGPVVSAVTGVVLVLLLRRPRLEWGEAPARSAELALSRRAALAAGGWRVILGINLVLGILLLFFSFTDYSLAGTIPDIVFPPVVFVTGCVALVAACRATTKRWRTWAKLSALLSITGGALYVIMTCLLFAFSILGAMFAMSEIADEQRIQAAVSPDGSRVAEVYFRGVGAYSGGNGRISVRVKHRLFPFVERDIYFLAQTIEANHDTRDYLSWQDNDTLYIPETKETVKVGLVKAQVPGVFVWPFALFQFISMVAEERQ